MLGGRGDDMLVGAIALLVVPFLLLRVAKALRSGEVPLYRTRLSRAEVGAAKFNFLVALNAIGAIILTVIGIDLIFGLGLKG